MQNGNDRRRILIVEDEPDLLRGLKDAFSFEGFEATGALDGTTGLRYARSQPPDCVILDLMLPDRDGFTVCEDLRRLLPRTPILILSARSQEGDIIRGLEVGADDYVTKPFGIGELVARVHALLRRLEREASPVPTEPIRIGAATVDFGAQTVALRRRRLPLSFYEAETLRLLYERAGEVVSREELLDRVWGQDGNPSNRTVDNVVVRLRRKLEDDAKNPHLILTVYGSGYKLIP